MAFNIPNAADAFDPNQAEPDAQDIAILVEALGGNGVISGGFVDALTSAGLAVRVGPAAVSINGAEVEIDGGDLALAPAESNPRFDLIVAIIDTGTGVQVVQGTANAEPVFPALPANSVALAAVFVPADAVETIDAHIVDKRVIMPASAFLSNAGLQISDTDGSHRLTVKPGSNLTAPRILGLNTGDADRVITLTGNPTLADWFDQSVKVAATPTFGGLTLSGLTSGRVVTAGASGVLQDSANLTFNGTTLAVTGLSNTGNTVLGDASGDTLTINGNTATAPNNLTISRTITSGAVAVPANIFRTDFLDVSGTNGTAGALLAYTASLNLAISGNSANGHRAFTAQTNINGAINQTGANPISNMTNALIVGSGGAGATVTNFANIAVVTPTVNATATITNNSSILVQNQQNANLSTTTYSALRILDQTAVTLPTEVSAIRSEISSGTGKFNIKVTGTAVNSMKGALGLDVTAPTISGVGLLDMNADTMRLRTSRTPASSGATGNQGEICWDSDYMYVAVGTNTWKRAALATW